MVGTLTFLGKRGEKQLSCCPLSIGGKAKPKDTEFGHKIWYAEVEGGLISEYRILVGNPPDAQQLVPTLKTHRRLFGQAPREVSGDRGIYSPENERAASVCLGLAVSRNAGSGASGKPGSGPRNASATGLKAALVTCGAHGA
jgi:hypothetical protein